MDMLSTSHSGLLLRKGVPANNKETTVGRPPHLFRTVFAKWLQYDIPVTQHNHSQASTAVIDDMVQIWC